MVQNIIEDRIVHDHKTDIGDFGDKAGSFFNQMYLVLDVMKKDLHHREMELQYSHANCKGTNK